MGFLVPYSVDEGGILKFLLMRREFVVVVGYKFLCKSHLWQVQTVLINLSKINIEFIKRSLLGYIFEILRDNSFQLKLYHVLLKTLERSCHARRTLSYRISSRSVEFILDNFALITRFSIHATEDVLLFQSIFHSITFKGDKHITFIKISRLFLVECAADNDFVTALRLALVYLVYLGQSGH